MRLGIGAWCSVTYSALICVYCSSYLSCVAAFSLPDIDIHCRSCAAPWAMWINTANTTPLKRHNPFCFGGGSFRCVCKWESLSVSLSLHTHTHVHTHGDIQTNSQARIAHTRTHSPLRAHFPFQKLLSIYRLWYVNLWNLTSGETIRPVLLQSAGIKRQKGEQKNRWEKRNTKETQCEKRAAEARFYYGVDNYSQRQGRLGRRLFLFFFSANGCLKGGLTEEATRFIFEPNGHIASHRFALKRAGTRAGWRRKGGPGDLSWDGAPDIWGAP